MSAHSSTDRGGRRRPAIWTPRAEILCHPCHGPAGDADFAAAGAPRARALASDELPGNCSRCGADVWMGGHVGPLAVIRAAVGGAMEQTGGMCSALFLDLPGGDVLCVTALDGPIVIGRYATREAMYEGDIIEQEEIGDEFAEGPPSPEDFAAALAYIRERLDG